METMNFVDVKFRNKIYSVDVSKLEHVMSRLLNRKIAFENEHDMHKYLKRYRLYDRFFFENFNKL